VSNVAVVGAQWGDEGKGKIIDVLSERADYIVRFQGGNNAGHTVKIGEETVVLHLIPTGILRPGKQCVIGNGAVVDPCAFRDEVSGLRARDVEPEGRLHVSDRAHLLLPFHRQLDSLRERLRAEGRKIGTTRRGIGPAYADKASRLGLRVCTLLRRDFAERVAERCREVNRLLTALGGEPMDVEETVAEVAAAAEVLRPFVTDTVSLLHRALAEGRRILFEGAQGALLDLDFGTYPFVTSSNASAAGVAAGTGVPPSKVGRVLGVIKGYTTRVGEGPFPTELADETGALLREDGHEYGATTGRPRRCGWFDAVAARYAAMVSGVELWAVTKLDVLDRMERIRICVGYEYGGKRLEAFPADSDILSAVTPVYEEMPGWRVPTSGIVRWDDLPGRARAYLERISQLTGVPLGMVSLGPERSDILMLRDPFS